MADNEIIAKRIVAEDLRCAAVIATSYGCPFEGKVPMKRVLDIAEQFAAAGATEVGFGDTTGMANPAYVERVLRRRHRAAARGRGHRALPQHPRPGTGQRIRRASGRLHELRVQFRRARRLPGAGRLHRKHRLGGSDQHVRGDGRVDTGCRLPAIIDAARAAQSVLGRKLTSHSIIAGPIDWKPNPDAPSCR